MASTFSNLKIQLMATGENAGTWGNTTNVNLGTAIEQALVETATVTFASADVTLTLTDSNSAQNARALRLNLAGTTGGARDLIVPNIQKPYIVNNGTADIITVKNSSGTGIAVPAGASMLLYNNGTNVLVAFNRVVGDVVGNVTGTASNATVLQTARTIAIQDGVTGTATSFNGSGNISIPVTGINVGVANAGTLAVGRGGTGTTSLTAENVIIGNTTSAVKFVAPGTSGNVLTSSGSAWASTAPAAPSAPTTAQVLNATAGASEGGVGTYALARATASGVRTAGTTYAGSGLIFSGLGPGTSASTSTTSSTGGSTLSGTWRAMGTVTPFNDTFRAHTLFLRIS